MSQSDIQELTIAELFSDGLNRPYIVPIYQRNYEWDAAEIEQLIRDIEEARERKVAHYYIGSLVVAKRQDGYFEVIDGQQRLTTLNILCRCLSKESSTNIRFEHRQAAENAFNLQGIKENCDEAIVHGFEIVQNELERMEQKAEFQKFLNQNVVIFRTVVPEHTDLNHYFEIMNTRGEQLEKHEILKARLMKKLAKGAEQKAFAAIWDACSDMSRFAIQGFKSDSRIALFGSDLNQIPNDFTEIVKNITGGSDDGDESKSIRSLLEEAVSERKPKRGHEDNEESEGQLTSIIDFPNFLMQVLTVWEKNGEHGLDEKFLLKAFDFLQNAEEIKAFMLLLLKCRLLFDRYILKSDSRKTEEGRWVIVKPVFNKEEKSIYAKNTFEKDKRLLTLQAMFQVSFTARNYKEWLRDILVWFDEKDQFELSELIEKLEEIADKYCVDRKGDLTYPKIQHYVLNYLDYKILCVFYQCQSADDQFDKNRIRDDMACFHLLDKQIKDDAVFGNLKTALENFQFFNRSSVEHYYPQNAVKKWSREDLVDSLGNLCLIGHRDNSLLSNREPSEKRNHVLERIKTKPAESAKQLLMMMYQEWNEEACQEHGELMQKLLASS